MSNQLHPIRKVFFDLGSTLVHYTAKWPDSFMDFATPMADYLHTSGLNFDTTQFLPLLRDKLVLKEPNESDGYREKPARLMLKEIMTELGCPELEDATIDRALRVMYSISESYWKTEENVIPILQTLKENGIQIGVISNAADDENIQNIIDLCHLRPWLDSIISSSKLGWGKPDHKIFDYALNQLDANPAESIMVGDHLYADILGANRMGIRSVWFTRFSRQRGQSIQDPELQPWRTIDQLDQLMEIILPATVY